MKKKRARMKKAPLLFILIIIIGCAIYYTMKSGKLAEFIDKNKLDKLGYSNTEISKILSNNDYLKYALNNDYNDNFAKLIKNKDFKLVNINKYYSYLKNNKSADINNTIYLVNKGISYTYSSALVSIVKEKYFILNRLERYMNYAKDYSSLTSKEIVTNVNCNLDYDYYTNVTPSDTSKGILMIANKYYSLDQYAPELVTMASKYTRVSGAQMNKEAYDAFVKLSDAAAKDGYSILSQSAYRSYATQLSLYNSYVSANGKVWAEKWSARPGYSEHQTGLALDVLTSSCKSLGDFENTDEFNWMKANSYKYGFIWRYQDDTTSLTGYGYEPWHYRYVGKDAAKIIYDNDITFDEYYAYYVLKK